MQYELSDHARLRRRERKLTLRGCNERLKTLTGANQTKTIQRWSIDWQRLPNKVTVFFAWSVIPAQRR